MDPADEALVKAAQAGDRAALGQLLARVERLVYRYGLRMCRDEEDAREVLQETLLALARNIGDFRQQSSLSTWLYTIARSFCIKQRRRHKDEPQRHDPLDAARDVAARSASPEEGAAAREIDRAVDEAIATLPPEQREVLLLRDGEGLTAPEVGAVLGLGIEAVKSRLHRARLAVRERVAPLLAPESLVAQAGCPDVAALLSQHLEDDITADVCTAMERHLEGCARCRATCDSLRLVLAHCRRSGDAPVPPGVQRKVRAALQDFVRPR